MRSNLSRNQFKVAIGRRNCMPYLISHSHLVAPFHCPCLVEADPHILIHRLAIGQFTPRLRGPRDGIACQRILEILYSGLRNRCPDTRHIS